MANSAFTPATFGQGIVVPGVSPGQVSALGLPGRTDGAAVASGYVGERLTTGVAVVAATTTNVAYNVQSLVIPSGVWKVEGSAGFNTGSITGNTLWIAGLSTSSAGFGTYPDYTLLPTTSGTIAPSASLFPLYLNQNSSSTVYLVSQYNFSSVGTSATSGRIVATRIA